MDKRQITFRTFKKYCVQKFRAPYAGADEYDCKSLRSNDGWNVSCEKKVCPVWKRLMRTDKPKMTFDNDDLMPCPCNPACRCRMDEPCLGCEEYGKWLRK